MRYLLYAVFLVGVVVGILALREATLSTHVRQDPDSRLQVVVHSSRNPSASATQSLAELTEAQVLFCRLEIDSDLVGELEPARVDRHSPLRDLGSDRFFFVLQPSLDNSNRRQFRGCLEDWRVDHLLVDVECMDVECMSDL